ncbi:hypothetical protein AVEN_91499-1 [Araneus ventricosus]|uniref:Uncharacterized protein n=1 Tax=Araneus ventricosus TaxID=182803 RepID=A0A4Y2BIR1_ARAVE|nr:hypothetical protein AVEN_91499-1 [Araneus ventricosus]
MLLNIWTELEFRWDVSRVTKGAHIENCSMYQKLGLWGLDVVKLNHDQTPRRSFNTQKDSNIPQLPHQSNRWNIGPQHMEMCQFCVFNESSVQSESTLELTILKSTLPVVSNHKTLPYGQDHRLSDICGLHQCHLIVHKLRMALLLWLISMYAEKCRVPFIRLLTIAASTCLTYCPTATRKTPVTRLAGDSRYRNGIFHFILEVKERGLFHLAQMEPAEVSFRVLLRSKTISSPNEVNC